ncbi:cysteine--tRNA ligase, partial [Microgenomates group bacterium]|nr:cysteine--tRNA ligase [Microgenomates group bacterium]
SCGITAYEYAHIGNLRRYVMDDVLVRLLRSQNFEVTYVQNVTDIGHLVSDEDEGEDKIEKTAAAQNKTPEEIARYFEDYFFSASDDIGNLRPDIIPRATAHIQEQIDLIKKLEDKGYTYIIEGDGVYFDTSKSPNYGYLARLDKEGLRAGERVEMVEGKKNPTDFALWKFEHHDDKSRAMVWPSPWGERTFPGWHTECVAMSQKYLGESYELHSGGIDHIPVHHTNEIAIAHAATNQDIYARYWIHHNFLRVENSKMSKSLGNIILLDDIKERGFNPRALRYLFLTAHYRKELNFTWESMAAAQKAYNKIVKEAYELKHTTSRDEFYDVLQDRLDDLHAKFYTPLLDDLNTATALTVLGQVFKSALPTRDKYELLLEFDEVLGLGLREEIANIEANPDLLQQLTLPKETLDPSLLSDEVKKLLQQRQTAKQAQNFAAADAFREQLRLLGFQVQDTSEGEQQVFILEG